MIDPLLSALKVTSYFQSFVCLRTFARVLLSRYQKWKRGKNPERGAKGATVIAVAREEGRERGESRGTRAPLSMLRGEFEGQSLVC